MATTSQRRLEPTSVRKFGTGLGSFELPDVHDIHARGDVLYAAEGRSPTFSVWDVSDKANPELLVRVPIPDGGYVHNIWPTDDDNFLLTTEETTEDAAEDAAAGDLNGEPR